MIELETVKDMVKINNFSLPLRQVVQSVLEILDSNYGQNRDVKHDMGGYIIIVEDEADLEELQNTYIEDITIVPEFVDVIGDNEYTHTLVLLSSDYSVSLIMPYSITPVKFINCIEGNGKDDICD